MVKQETTRAAQTALCFCSQTTKRTVSELLSFSVSAVRENRALCHCRAK